MSRVRVASLVLLALAPASAFAYLPGVGYEWSPLVPGYGEEVVLRDGSVDAGRFVLGDFLGVSAEDQGAPAWGDSGAIVGWDDAAEEFAGCPNANGDDLDGLWVRLEASGGWWDLGAPTDRVVVFTSQQGGPYLGEGLDYRVYGANALWAPEEELSAPAALLEVFLDGWRVHDPAEDADGNGWCSDDVTGVLQLPASYRYVKLVGWSGEGEFSAPVVDAVAGTRLAVPVDVRPGSCPNPFNVRSRGVLPVAILGTANFDASEVDPATVRLEGVAPARWSSEDVGTPLEPFVGRSGCRDGCAASGVDGLADLSLTFDAEALARALGEVRSRECRLLRLTAALYDGTEIVGEDVVLLLTPRRPGKPR